MFGKLINWLKIPVAQVPDDIAVCEFECAEQECQLQDWEHCQRRLDRCNSQSRNQHHPSC
jgi:hypothetical protein